MPAHPRKSAFVHRCHMPLLKCDFSAAMDPAWGIQSGALNALSEPACSVRDKMVADLPRFDDAGILLSPKRSLHEHSDLGFLSLPEELLAAYTTSREDSPMGNVFRIANGLHDEVDAVVVIGSPASLQTSRAIMQACCVTHHNESDRAQRGSKPRMYFLDNVHDNDLTSGILDRLQTGGRGDTRADRRFAVVVIHDRNNNRSIDVARHLVLEQLARTLGNESTDWLHRLVIDVAHERPRGLMDVADGTECEFIQVPRDLPATHSMLSPTTLLPAAFLGLDCMRMLAGAMQMTNHFKSADYATNQALQLAAADHLLHSRSKETSIRVTGVWTGALRGIAEWRSQLVLKNSDMPIPMPAVHPIDIRSPFVQSQPGSLAKTYHDVWVETVRTDPISVAVESPEPGIAENSLADMMLHQKQITLASRRESRFPTTEIVLQELDTHALGQLVQIWMIAAEIESRLIQ